MSGLAEQVYDHLAKIAHDDPGCGFVVNQHTEIDDDVAVVFRSGIIDSTPAVLAQTLLPWADSLRGDGFTVAVEYAWPGQQETKRPDGRRVPLWIHVIGYTPTDGE